MNESIVRMSGICYFSICKNYMFFYLDYSIPNKLISKPGGLESREQSRSRLISLDMSRPTFSSCWLFLNSQDQDWGLNFGFDWDHVKINWDFGGVGVGLQLIKPGGLESWEQSRSRLISLDMSRPTFWNCWLFLNSQDQDLGLNFSIDWDHVKTNRDLGGVGVGVTAM